MELIRVFQQTFIILMNMELIRVFQQRINIIISITRSLFPGFSLIFTLYLKVK